MFGRLNFLATQMLCDPAGKNIKEMGGGMGQLVFVNSCSWNCIFGTEYRTEIGKALLPKSSPDKLINTQAGPKRKKKKCSGTSKIGG